MATELESAMVRERAGSRCEYCRAPEQVTGYSFHVEHIIPRSKGGKSDLDNYALSCQPCNRAKWNHLTGEDPINGKSHRLFNPREDRWDFHFHLHETIIVRGKTAIGRATVARLELNQPRQLEARKLWADLYRTRLRRVPLVQSAFVRD
jgi:hypothetical protein